MHAGGQAGGAARHGRKQATAALAPGPPPPQIEPVYSQARISGNITGNVTAGSTMFASSGTSTCAAAPCTYSWHLTCTVGGANTSLATSAAAAVWWTSGPGAGFTIDTRNMSSPIPCLVTLLLTDGGASASNATRAFEVRPGSLFTCGRRRRLRSPASPPFPHAPTAVAEEAVAAV